jgi:replicative DNA helicase
MGGWPDDAEVEDWRSGRPDDNVCLRLNFGVIGIDVDAYDQKTGASTIHEAESRWGPLPPTYRSSSRDSDSVSGIRFYTVPEEVEFVAGLSFPDLECGHVDIIQPSYRYATVSPSIHPSGSKYRWYRPNGSKIDDGEVPSIVDLPALPDSWVQALSKTSLREEVFEGSRTKLPKESEVDDAMYERLTDLPEDGEPDSVVTKVLERAQVDLVLGSGSRYEVTRNHVARLVRLHVSGQKGVRRALISLRAAYVLTVADRAPMSIALAEFQRMTDGAALLIATTLPAGLTVDAGSDGAREGGRDGYGENFVPGGAFIFDDSPEVDCLWGSGDKVLWAKGEGLVIGGSQGVGKTTLAQQLVLTRIGVLTEPLLGLPVVGQPSKVLYLAMDRPRQIMRAFRRQCRPDHKDILNQMLVIWQGPPPADLAKNCRLLTEMAEQAGADVVVVDSLKDAAIGLTEDEVGAGWNRAAQALMRSGRDLLVLHHTKKQNGAKKTGIDDIYGSTWLTAGMGSVVLLDGDPGGSLIHFRHLKTPASAVGPMKVIHDQSAGLLSVHNEVNIVDLAGRGDGLTVKAASEALFGECTPVSQEKARRRLHNLATTGRVFKDTTGTAHVYRSLVEGSGRQGVKNS